MQTPLTTVRNPASSFLNRYLVPLAIAIVAAAFYLFRLAEAPMFVGGDESFFAINAHAIATTGRDLDGRLLPLFFKVDIHTWYQPVLVYLMALGFTVVQVSEWSLRAPMALIGVVDVLLIYAIGLRVFGRRRYAALAALMLAMAPPHMILVRQALDYACLLPFVLGWIWCLLKAIDDDSAMAATGAGLLLGVGFYSYIAAWFQMPIYFVMTLVALSLSRRRPRLMAAVTVGFVVPFALLIFWLRLQPDTLATIFARYGGADAGGVAAPFASLRNSLHYYVIQARLSLYWNYFDPVFLFLAGSPNVTMSTGKAGVFLIPAAVLLPLGAYEIIRRADRSLLFLAGFVTAPLAPVLINTGNAIQRELVVVVFGVLICTYGAVRLFASTAVLVRTGAMALIIAMPVQFAYFAYDYFGAYRLRAANWIDPISFDDVATHVMARDATAAVPRIYLSEAFDVGEARWRFYLAKYQRDDLWQRTWLVNPVAQTTWSVGARLLPIPLDGDAAPAGSLFVLAAGSAAAAALTPTTGCCEIVHTVHSATGETTALIIQRRR